MDRKRINREEARDLAEQYEVKAAMYLLNKKKGQASYKHMVKLYEDAGDIRKKLGGLNLGKAKEDYRKALGHAAYATDRKRIEGKINEVEPEREEAFELMDKLRKSFGRKSLPAYFSIITLTFALVFVSLSFTGNVVLGLTETNSRWIGLCLFACGLIFTFLYFRKKK